MQLLIMIQAVVLIILILLAIKLIKLKKEIRILIEINNTYINNLDIEISKAEIKLQMLDALIKKYKELLWVKK